MATMETRIGIQTCDQELRVSPCSSTRVQLEERYSCKRQMLRIIWGDHNGSSFIMQTKRKPAGNTDSSKPQSEDSNPNMFRAFAQHSELLTSNQNSWTASNSKYEQCPSMHFLLGLLRSLSFGLLRSEPHKQYSFTRFCACRMNCCKPISVSLAVKCRQQLINVLHRITITPISTEQAQEGAAELTSSVYRSQNSSVKFETESPTCISHPNS